jgi:hypothetical protein
LGRLAWLGVVPECRLVLFQRLEQCLAVAQHLLVLPLVLQVVSLIQRLVKRFHSNLLQQDLRIPPQIQLEANCLDNNWEIPLD